MLKKEEYIKTVRREYPPLFWTILLKGASTFEHYKNIIDEKFAIQNMIITDQVAYYAKTELHKAGEISYNEWKNPSKFKQAKEIILKREKEVIESSQKDELEKYWNKYESYMPALIFIFTTEIPLEKEIRKLLSEKLSQEETDKLMDKLNIPLQDNFYKQEEYDLVTTNDLQEHVKKYEWLFSRYGKRNPYTIEQAQEKLSQINKEEYLKKYKEEKIKLRQTISKAKEILEENAHLVNLMQFCIHYRTQRTDIMNKSHYLSIPLLEKKAESLSLTYDQLLNCTKEEIINNKIPSKELIEKRMNDFAIIEENGNIRCVIGEESEKLRKFLKEDIPNIKEIKGNIACKGIVKGKAKIILKTTDFHKFNEGDILVTSMTSPEFMPIMKKASAFITDEGGITSHAAIISREMKKPCIIGTKNATDVFKDGDFIEIDANKGVVRKLK